MRIWLLLLAASAVCGGLLLPNAEVEATPDGPCDCAGHPPPAIATAGLPAGPLHDAEQCLGGCAAVPADVIEADNAQIAGWLAAVRSLPAGAESDALEQLMYHWREAGPYVAARGREAVPPAQFEYLSRELRRDSVRVRARLTAADGSARVEFDRVLALGHRTHFWPSTVQGVQTPEFSGTVQRVGAHHFWARF